MLADRAKQARIIVASFSACRTATGTTRVAPGRAASLAAFRMPPVAPVAPQRAGGLIGRSFAVHQYKRGRRVRQLPPSAPPRKIAVSLRSGDWRLRFRLRRQYQNDLSQHKQTDRHRPYYGLCPSVFTFRTFANTRRLRPSRADSAVTNHRRLPLQLIRRLGTCTRKAAFTLRPLFPSRFPFPPVACRRDAVRRIFCERQRGLRPALRRDYPQTPVKVRRFYRGCGFAFASGGFARATR